MKDDKVKDLEKAKWYIDRAIDREKSESEDPKVCHECEHELVSIDNYPCNNCYHAHCEHDQDMWEQKKKEVLKVEYSWSNPPTGDDGLVLPKCRRDDYLNGAPLYGPEYPEFVIGNAPDGYGERTTRLCTDCEFFSTYMANYPCNNCYNVNSAHDQDMWEPKQKKTEVPKLCSECAYEDILLNQYPCDSCKHISIGTIDLWKAKDKEKQHEINNYIIDKHCYNCKYHPAYNYEEKCKNCIDRNWEPKDDGKRFEGSAQNPLHCIHHVKQWDSSNCCLSFATCDGSEENCCCFLRRHPHEKVGYDELVKLLEKT